MQLLFLAELNISVVMYNSACWRIRFHIKFLITFYIFLCIIISSSSSILFDIFSQKSVKYLYLTIYYLFFLN